MTGDPASPSADPLAAFDRALRRESHVLTRRPGLVWQQLHNRLQWEAEPVRRKVTAARELRRRETWLHLLEPFVESGELVRTLTPGTVEMHEERLPSGRVGVGRSMLFECAIAPDGTWVAAGSSDGMLRFWDVATGIERHAVRAHREACMACATSPDGRFVVSAGDRMLRLWDPESGENLGALRGDTAGVKGHAAGTNTCAVSPDARTVVSGSRDGTIRIWDVATTTQLAVLAGHEAPIACCAIGPDGSRILSAGLDGTLRLWSARTGERLGVLARPPGTLTACAIGPGGRIAVSSTGDAYRGAAFREKVARSGRGLDPGVAEQRSLQVWDLETGARLQTLYGHAAPVMGCAVGPDESYVVSAGLDRVVKLWDPDSGEELATLAGHSGPVGSCAASADGRTLVSTDAAGVLKVWDLSTVLSGQRGAVRRGHADGITRCAVSPDGRFAVSAGNDGRLEVRDAATGEARQALAGHEGVVLDCAVGPEGSFVVSAGYDGTLRVWDPETGAQLAILGAGGLRRSRRGHDGPVTACAVRADGAFVVSGGRDGTVRLWESATGKVRAVCTGHRGSISACAVDPGSRWLASGGADGSLRLWDPGTAEELAVLRHGAAVRDLAVAPDGAWVATARDDGVLQVWDPASGAELATLGGHTGPVLGCAPGPGPHGLASVGADGTLRVWDARGGQRALLVFPGDVTCVATHPADPVAVVGTSAGYLHRVRLNGPMSSPAP